MTSINQIEFIFNRNFNLVYLVMLFVSLIIMAEVFIKKRPIRRVQNVAVIVFATIFVFIFGLRNKIIGADTEMYIEFFHDIEFLDLNDVGFVLFIKIIKFIFNDVRLFLLITAFTYIVTICFLIKRKNYKYPFIFFFCWVSLFFFKSMGINTIRQGIAAGFFLLGLTYRNKFYKYGFMILACSFHISMVLPLFFFLAVTYYRNIKFYIIFYFLGAISSIIKFDIITKIGLLSGLNNVKEKADTYSQISSEIYKVGFRIDFFIFNSVFAILGYFIYKNKSNNDPNYTTYYGCYLLLSAVFFSMFNVGFSDRYGFMSWMFIPLLISPIFENDNIKLKLINPFSMYILCVFLAFLFYFIKV